MKATLILENGTIFPGRSIGAAEDRVCQMVFNTSMTGYQEILTDPNYAGQGIVLSYPLIGNYGVNHADSESGRPWAQALVVRHLAERGSNFRCEDSLNAYLKQFNITGIEGVDTRTITKTLRSEGTMNGMITCAEHFCAQTCIEQLKSHRVQGAVEQVTRAEPQTFPAQGTRKFRVALVDCGARHSLIGCLTGRGCEVTALSVLTPAATILNGGYDGAVLSGGPGAPEDCAPLGTLATHLYQSQLPLFATGLGHLILARAAGMETQPLLYDRGGSGPVKDLERGRVLIAARKQGHTVTGSSVVPNTARITHIDVNGGGIEGLYYGRGHCFSVQFHPESGAGLRDCAYLFDRFVTEMEECRHA